MVFSKASSHIFFGKLLKSVWLFPLICFLVLLILTSLKISGTSVGSYYRTLYGPKLDDPNVLVGRPRTIRSDEWEWQTPMAAAQDRANYPFTNMNIGAGQDMAVIVDAPYKHWSVVFKPQNLAFFVLPFANAFAFKWWFLSVLLLVSCYFFILLLLPKKRLLAALLSLCLLFSPFIQWWYQTITLAPIFYSFLIIISVAKLWQSKNTKSQALWIAALAYFLVCFAVVLYPPFQIPCAIVTAVFLLGYLASQGYLKNKKQFWYGVRSTTISLVLAGMLVLGFIAANQTAIDATRNSVYPGKRVSVSGDFDPGHFFSSFLDSQLQLARKAQNYAANQSEMSNFLLLSPPLTIAIIFALTRHTRRGKRAEWTLIAVTAIFLLFVIRLFIPGTDWLFKPLLLSSVPHVRLFIGIGLVSFMQLILFIRYLAQNKIIYPKLLAYGLPAALFALNIFVGLQIRQQYPAYIKQIPIIIVLAAFPAVIIWLLLQKKVTQAAVVLLVFSLGSAGIVHPLYRGTGPIINSDMTKQIEAIGKANPGKKWAVTDNLTFENLPAMSNVPSIINIYAYPQNDLWSQASEVSEQKEVYNRFAHTLAKFEPGPVHLYLKQPDYFEIIGSPCSRFYKDMSVQFIIANKDYSPLFPCLTVNKVFNFPNINFYILELR